jgi:hypothetical protein
MEISRQRKLGVCEGWIEAAALVVLFGFFVLKPLAYSVYMGQPPTSISTMTLRAGHGESKEARW